MIFARKIPEFCIIIVRKLFFPDFFFFLGGGHVPPPCLLSPTLMKNRSCFWAQIHVFIAKCGATENASMENASTELHGWKTQVRKTQVQICRGGKHKYGNGKSDLNPDVTEKYHKTGLLLDSNPLPHPMVPMGRPSEVVVTVSSLYCNLLITQCAVATRPYV